MLMLLVFELLLIIIILVAGIMIYKYFMGLLLTVLHSALSNTDVLSYNNCRGKTYKHSWIKSEILWNCSAGFTVKTKHCDVQHWTDDNVYFLI